MAGESRTGESRTGESRTGESRTGESRTGEELAIVLAVSVGRQRALLATQDARRWEHFGALLPVKRPSPAPPNPLAGFVADRCVLGRSLWVVSGDLRSVYLEYSSPGGFPAGCPGALRSMSWRAMSICLLRMGVEPGMRWIVQNEARTIHWTEQDPKARQFFAAMGLRPRKVRTWEGIDLK